MTVSFDEYKYHYIGQDSTNPDLPLMEREFVCKHTGEVVATIVVNTYDFFGNKSEVPHFVVSLPDLTFTTVPVSECTRVEDIYK